MTSHLDSTALLAHAVAAIGGTTRDGQVRMVEAVTATMAGEGEATHLAVQAGTGTGKSLAYLIPALAHALDTDTPVIVATATLALQRQLVERDLPRLIEAIDDEFARTPTFATLKGRANYLCLKQLNSDEGLFSADEITWMEPHLRRLSAWAEDTDTGDRDHMDPGVPQAVWNKMSMTSQDCPGAQVCPFGADCWAEKAKRVAYAADIVVTNHALLAIDALVPTSLLPEHDVVIIDEAHELTEVVTRQLTQVISIPALAISYQRAKKLAPAAGNRLTAANAAIDGWAGLVDTLPEGRWSPGASGAEASPASGGAHLPEGVPEALQVLSSALSELRSAVTGAAPDDEATADPEKHAERQRLSTHLGEQVTTIATILDAPAGTVTWLEERRVYVAPLSVSGDLGETLFEENTVIATSATLSLDGSFDTVLGEWGVTDCHGLDVGSPFDPAHSAILYIAADLPNPGREVDPAVYDQMEALIRAAGGRTLGLFSSHRALDAATEEMRTRLPEIEILRQGDDALGVLVDQFTATESTCLFGTLSLWQGVDVPGRTNSLVIIDKIPFARPDDPLTSARIDAAGRAGFMSVQIPRAGLLMAQAAGRLLRSIDDRGVVAVLDPRLTTKRYGAFLVRSMPPMWTTTSLDTVVAALERLTGA
ncbi:MAG: ATP-dependent DNA helicase [Corynebacterium sp.]|nr:ATP-dependent DNA helicase [Corynebacterium sp.]